VLFYIISTCRQTKKCDPEMAAASTLEERLLRERQGADLGQVALLTNREENAKRRKKIRRVGCCELRQQKMVVLIIVFV
jgi:hypothetical protein